MEKIEALAIPADAPYRVRCPLRFYSWADPGEAGYVNVHRETGDCRGAECAWWLWLERPESDPRPNGGGRGLCGGSPAVAALIGHVDGAPRVSSRASRLAGEEWEEEPL